MKIKKILINNYGPIKNFAIKTDDFELIFGLNETGKTAIVEVLSYVLFRKTSTSLRYGKPGNIIIEIEDDGRVHILPSKKMNIELPAGDIANLLYVKASESSIYGPKGEASFWDGIKSMLSKIGKGVPFTKLDGDIFEAVGLQPRKEEWKREKHIIIQDEKRRKEELEIYLKKIGEIENKETELVNLSEKNESLKRRLEEIDNFKNYKNYQELQKLYNAFQDTKNVLQDYERYKYEYFNGWQKLELEKESRLSDERTLVETKQAMKDLETEIAELKNREKIIDAEGLKSCITKAQEDIKQPSIIYPFILLLASIIIFILSFFTGIAELPASVIFVASLIIFIFFIYKKNVVKKLSVEKNIWLSRAKKVFPDISNLAELATMIETNEKMKIRKETLLEEKQKMIERLLKERPLARVDKEIAEIRTKTGLAEISDLSSKLAQKKKLEDEMTKTGANIAQRLHEGDDKKWERMISKMKTEKPEQEPDLDLEKDMRHEQNKTQEKIDILIKEIKIFREVEQARVNITDDHAAFLEYDQLSKKLKSYELERKAALTTRDILRRMSGELDEFIKDIIKGEDSLSEHFKLITKRYEEVAIKDGTFVVIDMAGKELKIDDLSSGAQDQLLLCFRMAALKRVYPEGAFLILDDAFIFADWHRRKKLIELLKKFIDDGNQVIYLTSDDHTRDLFKEFGARLTIL